MSSGTHKDLIVEWLDLLLSDNWLDSWVVPVFGVVAVAHGGHDRSRPTTAATTAMDGHTTHTRTKTKELSCVCVCGLYPTIGNSPQTLSGVSYCSPSPGPRDCDCELGSLEETLGRILH